MLGTSSVCISRDLCSIIYYWFAGTEVVVITSVALAQEVLDEKRFHKAISAPLAEVDNLGRGLFSSPHGDPEWAVARKSLCT
jgi:cytochrome P450/NADPH-cytochrome P450 reductase